MRPPIGHRDPDGELWVATGVVARLFHVSPKTVTRWAQEGRLPYRRTLGGPKGRSHRRFPMSKVLALVEQHPGGPPAPPEPPA